MFRKAAAPCPALPKSSVLSAALASSRHCSPAASKLLSQMHTLKRRQHGITRLGMGKPEAQPFCMGQAYTTAAKGNTGIGIALQVCPRVFCQRGSPNGQKFCLRPSMATSFMRAEARAVPNYARPLPGAAQKHRCHREYPCAQAMLQTPARAFYPAICADRPHRGTMWIDN